MMLEAPDERAAAEGYEFELERRGNRGLVVVLVELSDDPVELTVDADGIPIEEEAYGCTPSTKHPGRCAECGEPLVTKEEE